MTSVNRKNKGFSALEMLITVAIASTLSAITVPQLLGTIKNYRLSSAVASAKGAIQSTHYLAIMHGYPYQLTFTANSRSYQVACKPPTATDFLPVGAPIPIAGGNDATISQTAVMQFNSNGTMIGDAFFGISNGVTTSQISVSGVGYVSTTP